MTLWGVLVYNQIYIGGMDVQEIKLIRIQKYLSDMGIMSRRAAEKEIEKGNVTVNGIRANVGDKIDPANDALLLNGKPIAEQNKKYYVLLNKPAGYITSMSDEFGRKTVNDLLKDIPCRVYPAGRLDASSEGALICTNDGDFANRVIHPSNSHEKVYHVYAEGRVAKEKLHLLSELRRIDNVKIAPVGVKQLRAYPTHTIIEFRLTEGKNRQIRRMCEIAEIKIMQLKRISVGAVHLGDLSSGSWRPLTSAEIKSFGK